MKRLLLSLAIVAVAAASCQKDVVYNDRPAENNTIEQKVSPYAVSVDEALDRLDEELAAIYGKETRASQRRVRKIEPIKFSNVVTDTRAYDIDIDNLLYIVEFEDGQGSAILGADERVESVLAVLDNGALTAEDFNNAANDVETQQLKTSLADGIAKDAIRQVTTNNMIIIPDSSGFRVSYFEHVTDYEYSKMPLLTTCWDRRGYYNDMCLDEDDEDCDIPTLALAVAQMFAYNYQDDFWNWGGSVIDMRLVRLATCYNSSPSQEVKDEVAKYIAKICAALNINFNATNIQISDTTLYNAMSAVLGYSGIQWQTSTASTFENVAMPYIYEQNRPFIMEGSDLENFIKWHWVVDGIYSHKYSIYDCIYEGGVLVSRTLASTVTTKKVHCNFGLGGDYNGYYTFGAFDWSTPRSDDEYYPLYGDAEGDACDTEFDDDVRALLYSL